MKDDSKDKILNGSKSMFEKVLTSNEKLPFSKVNFIKFNFILNSFNINEFISILIS